MVRVAGLLLGLSVLITGTRSVTLKAGPEAKRRGLAVTFIIRQVMHATAVGDHFAVLIGGAIAADFRKGERSREAITDLLAGRETVAGLEAQIGTEGQESAA